MVVADRKEKVDRIRDIANAHPQRQCLVVSYVVD